MRYVRDQKSAYPNMLPNQTMFKDAMKLYNIKKSDRVIVYDSKKTLMSARLYWILYSYGHRNVSILAGGINKWLKEGLPVESTPESGAEEDYDYNLDESLVKDI